MSQFVDTVVTLFVSGVLLGGIYVLISIGLSLVFGVMGVINIAHGSFIILGGYAALVVQDVLGLNPLFSLFLIVPGLFAGGYVLQAKVVEVTVGEPVYSVLLTFGIAIVIEGVLRTVFSTTPQSVNVMSFSIALLGVSVMAKQVVAGSIGYLGAGSLGIFLSRSEIGQAIRATAQAPDLAEACGIDPYRIRAITFGIGTLLAGVGGLSYVLVFSVTPFVGRRLLLIAFIVVILGGMGSLVGTAIGGFVIAQIETFGAFYLGGTESDLLLFFTALLLLLVRPYGLMGRREEFHG